MSELAYGDDNIVILKLNISKQSNEKYMLLTLAKNKKWGETVRHSVLKDYVLI